MECGGGLKGIISGGRGCFAPVLVFVPVGVGVCVLVKRVREDIVEGTLVCSCRSSVFKLDIVVGMFEEVAGWRVGRLRVEPLYS